MRQILFLLLTITTMVSSYQTTSYQTKATTYGNAYAHELVSVYDGDTFKIHIDGYPAIVGYAISIRINGIDTPEIRSKDPIVKERAYIARDYAYTRLSNAQTIELCNMQRGKYFRIIADVLVDGSNLGEEMIALGLAVPYDGGTRPNWSQILATSN